MLAAHLARASAHPGADHPCRKSLASSGSSDNMHRFRRLADRSCRNADGSRAEGSGGRTMDVKVDEAIVRETTHCTKDLACLAPSTQELCRVKHCVQGTVHF